MKGGKGLKNRKSVSVFTLTVIFLGLMLMIRYFVLSPIVVDGASMTPTLEDEDLILVNKLSVVDRFDVIVFQGKNDETLYVKRVIGVPGDSIEYVDDVLYINGTAYEEPYLNSLKEQYPYRKLVGNLSFEKLYGMDTIPKNCYFVLGDNRIDSNDSRYPHTIGLISTEQILGEVEMIFYPFPHFDLIK